MSTTTAATPATTESIPEIKVRFGMRGKMLIAFALAFTLIFGLLAMFVIRFVTEQAQARLVSQLRETAVGASETLNVRGLESLITALPEPSAKFAELMKDPVYAEATNQLNAVFAVTGGPLPTGGLETVNGEIALVDPAGARPYTYFQDPNDGKLYWMTTPAAAWNPIPEFANPWRGSVEETVGGPAEPGQPKSTYDYMVDGLSAAIDQPSYTDANGTWISSYAPLVTDDGTKMAVGVDYYISYVDDVRSEAIRNVVPLLIAGWLLLLGLVLLVSTWLTRPLKRLTAATTRIAAGDYDVDLSQVAKTRVPDEMGVLAQSFTVMVDKVRTREKNLKTEVRKLKVEIDAKKREQAVNEITDSDFFSALTAKAGSMRQRMDEMANIDGDSAPTDPRPSVGSS